MMVYSDLTRRKFQAGLTAALFAMSAPAFASESSAGSTGGAQTESVEAAAEPAAPQETKQTEKKICRKLDRTGSLTPKKVCRKVAEPRKGDR